MAPVPPHLVTPGTDPTHGPGLLAPSALVGLHPLPWPVGTHGPWPLGAGLSRHLASTPRRDPNAVLVSKSVFVIVIGALVFGGLFPDQVSTYVRK